MYSTLLLWLPLFLVVSSFLEPALLIEAFVGVVGLKSPSAPCPFFPPPRLRLLVPVGVFPFQSDVTSLCCCKPQQASVFSLQQGTLLSFLVFVLIPECLPLAHSFATPDHVIAVCAEIVPIVRRDSKCTIILGVTLCTLFMSTFCVLWGLRTRVK